MKPAFISRVVVKNFKSIGYCEVKLGSLTYLVGANGSGKSNFVDALHFVRDALSGSLDNALNERGGIAQVRRRSSGHPNHFGIRLDFVLPDGEKGYYAFNVGAISGGGYEVQNEECVIAGVGKGPYFNVEKGELKSTSEESFPSVTSDRLALVSVSGMKTFRPVFDGLVLMGFYNLNPKVMKELQKPQDGRLLKPFGDNVASVIAHLERIAPDQKVKIEEYLQVVAPMVESFERKQIGPMETIEFRQAMAGAKHPWKFFAQNMSDGTLRALGVLTALFQANKDYAPTLIAIEEPETALHPAASGALRDALKEASTETQVIVTSHSPELLDDFNIDSDSIVAVTSQGGETAMAPIDEKSRDAVRDHLFSVGELLKLDRISPDRASIDQQLSAQKDLFGEVE